MIKISVTSLAMNLFHVQDTLSHTDEHLLQVKLKSLKTRLSYSPDKCDGMIDDKAGTICPPKFFRKHKNALT